MHHVTKTILASKVETERNKNTLNENNRGRKITLKKTRRPSTGKLFMSNRSNFRSAKNFEQKMPLGIVILNILT